VKEKNFKQIKQELTMLQNDNSELKVRMMIGRINWLKLTKKPIRTKNPKRRSKSYKKR
jgi:hypothetical protein